MSVTPETLADHAAALEAMSNVNPTTDGTCRRAAAAIREYLEALSQPHAGGEEVVEAANVEALSKGEADYQAYRRALAAEFADEPADLPGVLRMLERWTPDALPANEHGQVPFARALLEAAEDAIRKHLAALPHLSGKAGAGAVAVDTNERVTAGLIGLELEEAGKLPIGTQLTRSLAIRLIMHTLSSLQKRSTALTAGSAVQAQAYSHLIYDNDAADSVLARIAVYADIEPEEGENWESWYRAAFDMLASDAKDIFAALSPAAVAPGVGELPTWRTMDSAPKDGTMLALLVRPSTGEDDGWTPFADSSDPYQTIGFNALAVTGEDEWQFAGWDWCHDCFTEGHGTVEGWMPLAALSASPVQEGK